uniref:Uncharacterized protein n=1 Tax=Arundo donax TaxID=35708 RepID=A0A0A9FQL4_ARUDO
MFEKNSILVFSEIVAQVSVFMFIIQHVKFFTLILSVL